MFSNAGAWVRAHAPGASVVSTVPAFQGGYQPMSAMMLDGRIRQAPDPDDFSNGFALWSGTSFAAPLFAGWYSKEIGTINPTTDRRRQAVQRAWKAIEAGTDITA
jgi:hypothetical protein